MTKNQIYWLEQCRKTHRQMAAAKRATDPQERMKRKGRPLQIIKHPEYPNT
jgi:hypothetical protein